MSLSKKKILRRVSKQEWPAEPLEPIFVKSCQKLRSTDSDPFYWTFDEIINIFGKNQYTLIYNLPINQCPWCWRKPIRVLVHELCTPSCVQCNKSAFPEEYKDLLLTKDGRIYNKGSKHRQRHIGWFDIPTWAGSHPDHWSRLPWTQEE